MNLEVFALCDAATSNGKPSILGIFDMIHAKELPSIHPQMALAVRLRVSPDEGHEHDVVIKFIDPDGKEIIKDIKAHVKIKILEGVPSGNLNSIINIQQFKLEKFGDYTVELFVNENKMGEVPLFVRPLKEK